MELYGHFLADSVQIGEPILFSLSLKYPKDLEAVFPDSLHNYSPFELNSKRYFQTVSDSVFSTDSALYELTTFEIDTVQHLSLPVYIVTEQDSTILHTNTDSVILKQVVEAIPDSIAMKVNTEYVEVPMQFNYPYWTIGGIGGLLLLGLLWMIWGGKIKAHYKKYRLKKKHQKFLKRFSSLRTSDHSSPEPLLILWKNYMEATSKTPYSKLTTKEICNINNSNSLEKALHDIDRNIYGPKDESLLDNAYKEIEKQAIIEYKNQLEVLNG